MITFFTRPDGLAYAVAHGEPFSSEHIERLHWLFSPARLSDRQELPGYYAGPRREMVSPWSTNAVEICQNMNIPSIVRIEEFHSVDGPQADIDPMLQELYKGLGQDAFNVDRKAEPILYVEDIRAYNEQEGLALSEEEVAYLEGVSTEIGRKLTDSEVFGFSQVNSEHCRHKIFGGTFVIDGEEKESSLFELIKRTSRLNPNRLVSSYKDNVAFVEGPEVEMFAPASADKPDFFRTRDVETVLSLKAETHNFPTTVEPFNGAATGTGGEIRDRMAGGRASLPLAGTAVYMTSYPRLERMIPTGHPLSERQWLYQSPREILTKASNGASDFGNKFGQPLIAGSVLTFEHQESPEDVAYGYDKVIMLAGGIGYAKKSDALKGEPKPGETVVLMGGDNYRIGMGGGAVSSVNTGRYAGAIELNAVQRANPEMQKRVQNVIRALAESDNNPIVSIHDHGAGGHLNCFSELVETTGGHIDLDRLPVGDSTLSAKEIVGNESQERMGLLMEEKDVEQVARIAERERAPFYTVGKTTNDMRFVFERSNGERPIDLALSQMFGKPPRTLMEDKTVRHDYAPVHYKQKHLDEYIEQVLRLEAVACKDWLTNKVDRSVSGKVARQQCQGELQLPLSDLGAMALDYRFHSGMATAIGHAPQVALANAAAGSVLSIAEALTNIVFAPLKGGLEAVSLSANWMWPCRNEGEDARLYEAVQAASEFASALGINIPTGKDSLSMTQNYPSGKKVVSPGTVIISATGEVSDVRKIVSPVLVSAAGSALYYVDFSFTALSLGGSAFAQSQGRVGNDVPMVENTEYFATAFECVQELIAMDLVLAGHDISAGGLITTLLEMCFANTNGGLEVNLDSIAESDLVKILFAENPGVVLQISEPKRAEQILREAGIGFARIAKLQSERTISIQKDGEQYLFGIDHKRDVWYETSYLMDCFQSGNTHAGHRFENYKMQPVGYQFPKGFSGKFKDLGLNPDRKERSGITAAIVRDKGTNGEREMAYSLYLAGFDVKDVHLTDLTSGRETLEDVRMLVFCGGFSNSDVLGSAKGWAGGILFNERAKAAIDAFYARPDTLSLGICNGCQLMAELGLLYPEHEESHKMLLNESKKFESSFVSVSIPKNSSVMFSALSGTKLGIWCAHGEGRFALPYSEDHYRVAARYAYEAYPGNPNGSPHAIAALYSPDGRHLAMMPHLERAIMPWQCGYYPHKELLEHEITPWMIAFRAAYQWIKDYQH